MNDAFQQKVRTAAVAGWWTLLIAVAFITVQWIIYLAIISARPEWLMTLWGPDVTWSFIQNLVLWVVAVFKLCIWLMAVVVVWLTLWARQLRTVAKL